MEAMKAARDHGPWLCGKQFLYSQTTTQSEESKADQAKAEDVEKMVAMKAIRDYGPELCSDMLRIAESEGNAAAEAKAENKNNVIVVDDYDGSEDSQFPEF